MSFDDVMAELPKLSPEQWGLLRVRLAELAGKKWMDDGDPLTDAEKALLDARLAAYEKDPDVGVSWAQLEDRISSRFRPGIHDETSVENAGQPEHIPGMAMSVEQIISEARQLPREQAAELIDRLLVETLGRADPDIDAAWRKEIQQRIADIQSGKEIGVGGDEVMAELRKIVGR